MSTVILVTGATGQVGYHLLEALADAGAEATAMVRVEAKAVDLPGSPQHVVATLDGPPPSEVLQTFDRIFLLSPAHEGQAELYLSGNVSAPEPDWYRRYAVAKWTTKTCRSRPRKSRCWAAGEAGGRRPPYSSCST